jgi:glycosyltransferase involved in cell wall biosynthesis
MIQGMCVWVVVPAFQEGALVGGVLRTMPAFVDHVVVVDDASTDDTSAAARASGDPRVSVVRHGANRGVGAAIVTGYRAALRAGGALRDVVAVMAGDAQMHPDDLSAVAAPVARGEADYVKGTRFGHPALWREMGVSRYAGGKVLSWLTARATGLDITDSQCGYTAISRGALAALDLDGLWEGFGYPNDLLSQLAVRRRVVQEVAVRPVYAAERSKLRARHVPRIFALVGRAALRRAVSPIWGTDGQAASGGREPYPCRKAQLANDTDHGSSAAAGEADDARGDGDAAGQRLATRGPAQQAPGGVAAPGAPRPVRDEKLHVPAGARP